MSGKAVVDGLAELSFSGTLSASFDSANNMSFAATGLDISVDGFGTVTGDVSFQKSADGDILVAASNVSADIGVSGTGFALSNGTLGLYVAARTEDSAGYAILASGDVSLNGFPGVVVTASDATIRVNTLNKSVNETVAGVDIIFADTSAIQELSIGSATVALAGVGSVTGAIAITSETTLNDQAQTVVKTKIGISDANGTLDLGALGASLNNGRGAIVLNKVGTDAGTYGVQLEGDISVTGADGINLSATDMKVSYNRLGQAVSGLVVQTGGADYVVDLLDNETRISGQATAEVAGLGLSGNIFIEVREDVVSQLIDGSGSTSAVTVDQTIIGGSNLSVEYSQGGTSYAVIGDANIAVVLSQDISDSSERWVSATGSLGSINVLGTDISNIKNAELVLNQKISAAGNLIEDSNATVLNWANDAQTFVLSARDTAKTAIIDMGDRRWELPVSGAVDFGASRLSGSFIIVLDRNENSARVWDISAQDVTISVAAGGAKVALQNGAGSLYLSETEKKGSISGDIMIDGLGGLSATGTLSATFADDELVLSGSDVDINIDGLGAVSGGFAVEKIGQNLLVGITNSAADFGGVALSSGALGLFVSQNSAGADGYALVGSA